MFVFSLFVLLLCTLWELCACFLIYILFFTDQKNNNLALRQLEDWDRLEDERGLSMEECKAKREAIENYKWVLIEEIHWRQKSRESWLREGDRNTGFFHRLANFHFKTNSLIRIKINGFWCSEKREIRAGVPNAFQQLLTENQEWRAEIDGLCFDTRSPEEASNQDITFREDEVKVVLLDLNGDKTQGLHFSFLASF